MDGGQGGRGWQYQHTSQAANRQTQSQQGSQYLSEQGWASQQHRQPVVDIPQYQPEHLLGYQHQPLSQPYPSRTGSEQWQQHAPVSYAPPSYHQYTRHAPPVVQGVYPPHSNAHHVFPEQMQFSQHARMHHPQMHTLPRIEPIATVQGSPDAHHVSSQPSGTQQSSQVHTDQQSRRASQGPTPNARHQAHQALISLQTDSFQQSKIQASPRVAQSQDSNDASDPPPSATHIPRVETVILRVPPTPTENPRDLRETPNGSIGKLKPSSLPATVKEESTNDVLDHRSILLSLAEHYINSARSMSLTLARSPDDPDLQQQYNALMTAGLSCLHAVLHGWQITDPRDDAKLRLYYANLLFEETDNDEVAQDVLSKGISLCERSKLLDQKYAMQYLLARIQHKSSATTASATIDMALEDVLAFKNRPWIYVFRLLKISLLLGSNKSSHAIACLDQIRALAKTSERKDTAISIMATLLEVLVHLRSNVSDAIEQAQRALTTAMSYQMDKSFESIPQLRGLMLTVDLLLTLMSHRFEHHIAKVEALQRFVDELGQDRKSWRSSSFQLPTSSAGSDDLLDITCGILRTTDDKHISVGCRWTNKNELFMLSFLLCAVAKLQKNCLDEQAERYLTEGIDYAKKSALDKSNTSRSLQAAVDSTAREETMSITMQVLRVFAQATRSNWQLARKSLEELRHGHSKSALSPMEQTLIYLDGCLHQAQGQLDNATKAYESPMLSLSDVSGKLRGPDLDIRLLASMNRLLIMTSSQQHNSAALELLDLVESHCVTHGNPMIQAAGQMLKAVCTPNMPILQLKAALQASLQPAQRAQHHLLLKIIMNVMVVRFFNGIVGDQAEKSAHVGFQLSRRMRNPLWMSVSGQNFAKCMALQGKHDEAQMRTSEASNAWKRVPPGVKAHFTTEQA